MTGTALQAHPYRWPTIGYLSDLRAITRDDLYRHYRTFYVPGNAVLVLVGDFETGMALRMIRRHFGRIPRGGTPPELRTIEPEARAFADVLVKSVQAVGDAVRCLRDLRDREALSAHCTEINRLENEGDQLLRRAVARLFHDSTDPIHVIKWKEIYDNLENAIDRCEDVANVIEGVALEYA